jgi:hypothetical protein
LTLKVAHYALIRFQGPIIIVKIKLAPFHGSIGQFHRNPKTQTKLLLGLKLLPDLEEIFNLLPQLFLFLVPAPVSSQGSVALNLNRSNGFTSSTRMKSELSFRFQLWFNEQPND